MKRQFRKDREHLRHSWGDVHSTVCQVLSWAPPLLHTRRTPRPSRHHSPQPTEMFSWLESLLFSHANLPTTPEENGVHDHFIAQAKVMEYPPGISLKRKSQLLSLHLAEAQGWPRAGPSPHKGCFPTLLVLTVQHASTADGPASPGVQPLSVNPPPNSEQSLASEGHSSKALWFP